MWGSQAHLWHRSVLLTLGRGSYGHEGNEYILAPRCSGGEDSHRQCLSEMAVCRGLPSALRAILEANFLKLAHSPSMWNFQKPPSPGAWTGNWAIWKLGRLVPCLVITGKQVSHTGPQDRGATGCTVGLIPIKVSLGFL